jgi:DNA repair exonuclease SbcCD nuclease subunit
MPLTIFHTSDLHLGMKFAGYEGSVREALVEARFNCLFRLVRNANERKCDLFVVAGDLFERTDVAKKDIVRAVQALAGFEGHLVAVLPGNHDFAAPDGMGLWATVREMGGDNLLVLDKRQPVDLTHYGMDAVLYPCHCTSKHASEDATSWVRDQNIDAGRKHHIGIAHGSIEGVSPDFNADYYPIDREALKSCRVPLWLLGHTHVRYPINPPGRDDRIFYAGTPEPDGFDCDHRGSAWIHELADDGTRVSEPLTTGEYRFRHDEVPLAKASDLADLASRYADESNRKLLLKLKLSGRVPTEVLEQLPEVRRLVERLVIWLKFDDADVTRQITAHDIDATFTTGSFPHRLLKKLAETDADSEALQEAHRLIMEARQ